MQITVYNNKYTYPAVKCNMSRETKIFWAGMLFYQLVLNLFHDVGIKKVFGSTWKENQWATKQQLIYEN